MAKTFKSDRERMREDEMKRRMEEERGEGGQSGEGGRHSRNWVAAGPDLASCAGKEGKPQHQPLSKTNQGGTSFYSSHENHHNNHHNSHGVIAITVGSTWTKRCDALPTRCGSLKTRVSICSYHTTTNLSVDRIGEISYFAGIGFKPLLQW